MFVGASWHRAVRPDSHHCWQSDSEELGRGGCSKPRAGLLLFFLSHRTTGQASPTSALCEFETIRDSDYFSVLDR